MELLEAELRELEDVRSYEGKHIPKSSKDF
ncbi:hypothetical protein COLO4_29083 [Corchorus olitorius]|uniref:Uncharacterized protein n=1 Tax=Corchorus olitorius TaxID=93759 RepID=A0A1R3HG88_9ROSI|nr:hypothetical protein COLO4_29083 [Corchorus olitorius]